MGNFFDPDGGVMKALSRIADLAILNILWMLFCLPVVTAGAATTALFYMCLKMVKNREGYLIRGFAKAFKDNFRKSTIIWIVFLAILLVLGGDFWIMCNWENTLRYPMLVLIILALLLVVFILLYVFALIGKFENTVLEYVKNAFFMSIKHFPATILLFVIFCLQIYICLFVMVNDQYLPLLFLFGGSAFVYLMCFVHQWVFKQYTGEEEEEFITEEM